MRVGELMTTKVRTVPAAMAARDAWELMRRERIHHLLVGSLREVVGVLSDRDAGGPHGDEIRDRATVAELMTPDPVTIDAHATVRQAANLIRGRTIGCLPITEGDRVVGIVTVSDLLEVLGRGVDRPSQPERTPLSHRVPHRKQHGAFGKW